jgi:hypothetical protein
VTCRCTAVVLKTPTQHRVEGSRCYPAVTREVGKSASQRLSIRIYQYNRLIINYYTDFSGSDYRSKPLDFSHLRPDVVLGFLAQRSDTVQSQHDFGGCN